MPTPQDPLITKKHSTDICPLDIYGRSQSVHSNVSLALQYHHAHAQSRMWEIHTTQQLYLCYSLRHGQWVGCNTFVPGIYAGEGSNPHILNRLQTAALLTGGHTGTERSKKHLFQWEQRPLEKPLQQGFTP